MPKDLTTYELVSERLLLRPLVPDEATTLHRLWTDEPVRRFLWDGQIITLEETQEILERNSRLFEESDFGIWGIHETTARQLIGFAGYWYFRTPPSLELVFAVSSDHWNRGIATEAAKRVIRYGFEELGFDIIRASTDAPNVASQRVIKKVAMSLDHQDVVKGLDTLFYSLARDIWRKRYVALAVEG